MCVLWDARPSPVCYSPSSSVPCERDCKVLPSGPKPVFPDVASMALSNPACECRSLRCVKQTSGVRLYWGQLHIKHVSSAFCFLDLARLGLWQPPHGSGETQCQNDSKSIDCGQLQMTFTSFTSFTSQFSSLKSASSLEECMSGTGLEIRGFQGCFKTVKKLRRQVAERN